MSRSLIDYFLTKPQISLPNSGELMNPIRPVGSTKKLTQACYTPDGSMVIGGDDGGSITLYDSKRGSQVRKNTFEIS